MLRSKNIKKLGLLSIALLISLTIPASSSHLFATTTGGKESKPNVCQTSFEQTASKDSTLTSCNPRKPIVNKRICDVGAFVIDKDPKGLNVRSGPGTQYQIIGKLPTIYKIAPVEVGIAASVGNWVMITGAKTPAEGKIEFQAVGWVYAPLLGIITGGQSGIWRYTHPNKNSPKLVTMLPSTTIMKLNTCSGKWVKIEHENRKAWLAPQDYCPTLITRCS